MQRHRRHQVGLGQKGGPAACQPGAEGRGGLGAVGMLEAQDQAPAGLVIDESGAGMGEGRGVAQAGPAEQGLGLPGIAGRIGIEGKRRAAAGAQRRSQPGDPPPAGRAQALGPGYGRPAAEAQGRQHRIQRKGARAFQPTGHDRGSRHRPRGERLRCPVVNRAPICGIVERMSEVSQVFDRRAVRRHRERAAAGASAHDFLFREVGERLVERIDEVRRDFPLALELGARDGAVGGLLKGRGGIETLVEADLAPGLLRLLPSAGGNGGRAGLRRVAVAADEEWLPFRRASLDLVLSCLSLHWVNDLPGALIQIRQALKPDGLFLAAMLGGETLSELRQALMEAELEVSGGASPRVSPFADVRDLGQLLQRAGFALPMVDRDEITVTYGTALDLMHDLRGMGETNAVGERLRRFTPRGLLLRAADIYQQRFSAPIAPGDGCRVRATFQVLFLTAWAPGAGQPQALKPGSAAARLAAALGTEEQTAGEKAAPPSGSDRTT